MADATPTNEEALAAARRQRNELMERLHWWEEHKFNVLIPMAAGAFGAGFGLGYLLRELVGAPQPTSYLMGVATLLISGKVVDRYTSPTRLRLLDTQIERLERKKK